MNVSDEVPTTYVIYLLTYTHPPMAGSSIGIGTLSRGWILMSKNRMRIGGVHIRRAGAAIRHIMHGHKIGRGLVLVMIRQGRHNHQDHLQKNTYDSDM